MRTEHSRRMADEANALRSEEDRINERTQQLAQEQARLLDEKRNVEEERQGLLDDMKELQRRLDAKADLEHRERAVLEREQQLHASMVVLIHVVVAFIFRYREPTRASWSRLLKPSYNLIEKRRR